MIDVILKITYNTHMTPTIIIPTFTNEADRLNFLSRLWGVTITSEDVADWEAYKLVQPTKLIETDSEYSERRRDWNEERVLRHSHYILSKFEGYGLGKTKPSAETYLALRPNPDRPQAREAVRLQLLEKWADKLVSVDVNDLLPLVQGIING